MVPRWSVFVTYWFQCSWWTNIAVFCQKCTRQVSTQPSVSQQGNSMRPRQLRLYYDSISSFKWFRGLRGHPQLDPSAWTSELCLVHCQYQSLPLILLSCYSSVHVNDYLAEPGLGTTGNVFETVPCLPCIFRRKIPLNTKYFVRSSIFFRTMKMHCYQSCERKNNDSSVSREGVRVVFVAVTVNASVRDAYRESISRLWRSVSTDW